MAFCFFLNMLFWYSLIQSHSFSEYIFWWLPEYIDRWYFFSFTLVHPSNFHLNVPQVSQTLCLKLKLQTCFPPLFPKSVNSPIRSETSRILAETSVTLAPLSSSPEPPSYQLTIFYSLPSPGAVSSTTPSTCPPSPLAQTAPQPPGLSVPRPSWAPETAVPSEQSFLSTNLIVSLLLLLAQRCVCVRDWIRTMLLVPWAPLDTVVPVLKCYS